MLGGVRDVRSLHGLLGRGVDGEIMVVDKIVRVHEQGMFELRGAVQFTVKKLGCSQASIYRYIKKAKTAST